jgi:hypothetical protein
MIELEDLKMGIWSEDGDRVWLPKELFPTRSDAKRFAVMYCEATWIDVRVRTRWMAYAPHSAFDDYPYHLTDKDDEGAFACWEIT